MKYHLLYNPHAGKGSAKDDAALISVNYSEEVVLRDITEINDYAAFFASLDADDSIILCGGDGTLNRFINDTDGIPYTNPILYYASGSGNDFARDIGKEGERNPFPINEYINELPLVEVDGKSYRFLNNVGFGIDGYCCEVGDALKAKQVESINYTSIAIKGLLFHFKPAGARVKVDGKEYEYKKVWIAPTMKGRFYGGGMMPTPEQDRKAPDGELSLMVFHGTGKIKTLMIFPSLFKGEHIKHTKHVTIHTGKEIEVTFDRPTSLQIDGETILGVTSYRAFAKVQADKTTSDSQEELAKA